MDPAAYLIHVDWLLFSREIGGPCWLVLDLSHCILIILHTAAVLLTWPFKHLGWQYLCVNRGSPSMFNLCMAWFKVAKGRDICSS